MSLGSDIALGTVWAMRSSRTAAPTSASILSMSAGLGPICRSAKAQRGWASAPPGCLPSPDCRRLQPRLSRAVHRPESLRGSVAPSAPRDSGALPFGVVGSPHDTTITTERSGGCLIGNWPPVLCRPARSVSDRCQPQQPGASARRATPMRQAEHRSRRPSSGGTEGLRYPHRSPSFFLGVTR